MTWHKYCSMPAQHTHVSDLGLRHYRWALSDRANLAWGMYMWSVWHSAKLHAWLRCSHKSNWSSGHASWYTMWVCMIAAFQQAHWNTCPDQSKLVCHTPANWVQQSAVQHTTHTPPWFGSEQPRAPLQADLPRHDLLLTRAEKVHCYTVVLPAIFAFSPNVKSDARMHLPGDFCIPSKMLHLCLRDCTADEQLVDLNAFTTLTDVVLATNTFCVQLPNSVKRLRVDYTGHEVDFERLGQPPTHLEEFVFDYQHQYVERDGSWERQPLPPLPITPITTEALISVPKHYINWGHVFESDSITQIFVRLSETGKVTMGEYKSLAWISQQGFSSITFYKRFDQRFHR